MHEQVQSPRAEPPDGAIRLTEAPVVEFGPFQLDLRARRLRRGRDVLPVTPRAFDILAILIERAGQTVSKTELMQRVWPDVFVEEGNLAQHVSQLRRLLGDTARQPIYITTLPRQGYQFIASIRPVLEAPQAEPAPSTAARNWRAMGAVAVVGLLIVVTAAVGALWRGTGDPAASPNAAAQRAFERGRFLVAQNKPDSTVLARDAFEEAVRLDPGFTRAQAQLALVHVAMFLARKAPRTQALEGAQAAASRALSLDADAAEAHIAQGAIALQLLGNAPLAESALRRAVALDGSNAMALDLLARALRQGGRFDESMTVARRALALEPTSVRAHMNLAQSMLFAGRNLDDALQLCRQALELDPGSVQALEQAAEVAEAAARFDEAVAFRARAERASTRPTVAEMLDTIYRERGFAAAMTRYLEVRLESLDRVRPNDPATGFERGRLLAKLGRLDEAFTAFDAAVAGGYSVGVMALRHHPAYRALRADPRFESLHARAVQR